MSEKQILSMIPTEVYAFIGFVIVSNVALVASGFTALMRHVIDYNRLKDDVGRLKSEHDGLKKSLDTVWDRVRSIAK